MKLNWINDQAREGDYRLMVVRERSGRGWIVRVQNVVDGRADSDVWRTKTDAKSRGIEMLRAFQRQDERTQRSRNENRCGCGAHGYRYYENNGPLCGECYDRMEQEKAK